jgi:putative PIG3 family NAD(P)H quinone oxidoreductase
MLLPGKPDRAQLAAMAGPETMTAIAMIALGGPEVLALDKLPVPRPEPGEVLIRVAGAGVNAPDLAQRRGDYPPPAGHSPILGLEVSGTVVVPAGAWREGDEVVALTNGGGYAGYVAVPAGQVLPRPAGWPQRDAAALPETWFTITQTLVLRAGLGPGMSVLVYGAAGGLGGAAILIATILGADAIAVVSSAEKAAYATSLGARAVIRRDREDIVERTRALTGGRGADLILDIAGGDVTRANIDAAARFGHIVLAATLANREATLPLNQIVQRQLTLSGSTLRPQPPETKAAIAAHIRAHLWPALGDPAFPRPRIATYRLAEAAAAHRALETPGHIGKLVLDVSNP